jgi:16S rRNA G966 N2-methylase RsmD
MIKSLETRWADGTKELLSKLEEKGVKFDKLNTLEMFGRDGTWQTTIYANKVRSLEVWEIDSQWKDSLEKNLPSATIKIKDSIQCIKKKSDHHKFDLIMIDNPMNTFGPKLDENEAGCYCEHFDIIKEIGKIIDNEAIVVFNVNRKPFDYEKYPLWKARREEFYGNKKTDNLSLAFLHKFYRRLFEEIGFMTVFCFNVVRVLYGGADMTHYFAYSLRKIK